MLHTTEVIGRLEDEKFKNATIDYVDIDWYDAYKRLHRKTTKAGTDIAMEFDNHMLVTGLSQDDVVHFDGTTAIVVNIPETEALVVTVPDVKSIAKACYEIGNKHAVLFYGDDEFSFVTPYDKPSQIMLQKLGYKAEKQVLKFDFTKKISTSISAHTH